MRGKKYCSSKQIPEDILINKICEVLNLKEFDEKVFLSKVKYIKVENNNLLTIYQHDNACFSTVWQDKSRALSWTPEMREMARKRALAV